MFTYFLDLPPELKLPIIQKLKPISYVRLFQSCHYVKNFCEDHKKSLGIYIYRKEPHIFLTNSLEETFPFYKRLESDNDINQPYCVVDYGRFYGDANLKVPMTVDNIDTIRQAITGFGFPEMSVLNHSSLDDDTGNSLFCQAFPYFMEVVEHLHVVMISVRNVTVEQFNMLTAKWDFASIRLRKSMLNMDLINSEVIKTIDRFSCTFSSNLCIPSINFPSLLQEKSILTLDFGSWENNFKWEGLEEILKNYELRYPNICYYSLYLEEQPPFYDVNLEEKEGIIFPIGSFYIGRFESREIPNCNLEESRNQDQKFDYFIHELIPDKRWRFISISRKLWSFSTDISIVLDRISGNDDLNLSFLSIIEEVLRNGYCIDFSVIYERLAEAESFEERGNEVVKYIDFIVKFYE